MQVFVNINSQRFLLNGIPYYKNFMPLVIGNKLKVVNVYDSKLQLFDFEDFGNVSVNGNTFGSVALLVSALLPAIFTRDTLGSASSTQLNEILSAPPILRVGTTNTFTFPIGYTWRYDNVLYGNTVSINRTIATAPDGFKRIDIAVVDLFNNIVIVSGVQGEEVVFEPPTPPNTLRLTSFSINGDLVSEPTTPIVGIYVEKAEFIQKNIFGTGEISVVLDTQETNFVLASDGITMVEGTAPTSIYLANYLRDDKILSFYNATSNPIVFKHSVEEHNFRMPDGANLTVQPNELVRFRQFKDDVLCYQFDSLSRVGGGTTPSLTEVLTAGYEAEDLPIKLFSGAFFAEHTFDYSQYFNQENIAGQIWSEVNYQGFFLYDNVNSKEASYNVDKITNNDVDYPLPDGVTSKIATLNDLETGYIPLTGTTEDNKVTGDIEVSESAKTFWIRGAFYPDDYYSIAFGEGGITLNYYNVDEVSSKSILFSSVGGLFGDSDYSDLTTENKNIYAQRQYVDNQFGKLIQLTTTEILALTPEIGRLYYNTTINEVVFYDGTNWKKLSHTNM